MEKILTAILAVVLSAGCGQSTTVAPVPRASPVVSDDASAPVTDDASAGPVSSNDPGDAGSGQSMGTAWHLDSDGDGVPFGKDDCPDVYNPIGQPCDLPSPKKGEGVVDLHAQHVTPYGAWLSFTSPHTAQYGWQAIVAVSEDRSSLATKEGIAKVVAGGIYQEGKVRAPMGEPVSRPFILTDLDPGKTYYVTARRRDYDGISDKTSNVIKIVTHDNPSLSAQGSHPRAFATASLLAGMKKHGASVAGMGDRVVAASKKPNQYNQPFCIAAALMAYATDDKRYAVASRKLIDATRNRWEGSELDGRNDFRRANSLLAICTDLMWNRLSRSERDRNVRAFLAKDEHHVYGDVRFDDTDEVASRTRSAVVDGIVACGSDDIDPALSSRGCKLLDWGKRMLYGVSLVKARRDKGFWAQSGGHLPDGSFYHHGSSTYWLQTLLAAHNAGGGVEEYAAWVLNNLRAVNVHSMTPRRAGYYSFGDVESYDNPIEPGSMPVRASHGEGALLRMAFLAATGDADGASMARASAAGYASIDAGRTPPYRWPLLVYGNTSSSAVELSTSFYDSGMGIVYDRTSWSPDASMLVFQAGWNGVDHSHGGMGHFQLYRRGRWMTHESLGYNGPAAGSEGHNVLQLEVDGKKGPIFDQYWRNAIGGDSIIRSSRSAKHIYIEADVTSSYRSYYRRSKNYSSVRRHAHWLKSDGSGSPDIVVTMDDVRVGDAGDGGGPNSPRWQIHLPVSANVIGRSATAVIGAGEDASRLTVSSVLPLRSRVTVAPPGGLPNKYPGEVYTHRVIVEAAPRGGVLRMVTVLHASSPGSKDAVVRPVDSVGVVGAVIGDVAVLFGNGVAKMPDGVKRVWRDGEIESV